MKVWELKEILDDYDDDTYVLVLSESEIHEHCPVIGHTECDYDSITNQLEIRCDNKKNTLYLEKAIILWPKE